MSRVDAKSSRHFSLYLEDANTKGYGFQAFLVEKNAIPRIKSAMNKLEQARAIFLQTAIHAASSEHPIMRNALRRQDGASVSLLLIQASWRLENSN